MSRNVFLFVNPLFVVSQSGCKSKCSIFNRQEIFEVFLENISKQNHNLLSAYQWNIPFLTGRKVNLHF